MKAGLLSDRLVFESRDVAHNAENQAVITWSEDFTTWGQPIRNSELSARFYIRYRANVTSISHRILWDGSIWVPTAVTHDRKRTMLTIEADRGELVEVTHLLSTEKEYIDGVPDLRPPE